VLIADRLQGTAGTLRKIGTPPGVAPPIIDRHSAAGLRPETAQRFAILVSLRTGAVQATMRTGKDSMPRIKLA
jgi:hypothetical protein